MFVSIIGTTSDCPTTSTTLNCTSIDQEVYYIHSKEESDYEDNQAYKREEKEWVMTGWINPRKINIPKFNVILQKRKMIRNALPRKVRECHS